MFNVILNKQKNNGTQNNFKKRTPFFYTPYCQNNYKTEFLLYTSHFFKLILKILSGAMNVIYFIQ